MQIYHKTKPADISAGWLVLLYFMYKYNLKDAAAFSQDHHS